MWIKIIAICIAFSTTLSAEINILAFAGSTRSESLNKKLVAEAANSASQMGGNVISIDLRDFPIPYYDEDLETKEGMPEKAKEFRKLLIQNDIILIASPEYNGSVSAVLKNAIDWASRGESGGSSREAFKGKKFIIMSASPSSGGGSKGLQHLKSIIENIGGIVAAEVKVPDSFNAFDEKGHLKNEGTKREIDQGLQKVMAKPK